MNLSLKSGHGISPLVRQQQKIRIVMSDITTDNRTDITDITIASYKQLVRQIKKLTRHSNPRIQTAAMRIELRLMATASIDAMIAAERLVKKARNISNASPNFKA